MTTRTPAAASPQRTNCMCPSGVPVKLSLQSTDVIHSFWVPSLAGKEDLIPGWKNDITFTAERPGVYRGQCAEFCGMQHAHMGLLVIADPPEVFQRVVQ